MSIIGSRDHADMSFYRIELCQKLYISHYVEISSHPELFARFIRVLSLPQLLNSSSPIMPNRRVTISPDKVVSIGPCCLVAKYAVL